MRAERFTGRSGFGKPEAKGTVFSRKGASIRYWLYGDTGIPLVLCNGLFSGVETWEPFVLHFSRTCRVLVWEYPGHGFSAGEDPGNGAGIDAYAEDCSLLLEGVGIEKAVFVGYGTGVQVILELYRQHPETVKAMVGVCGAEQGPLSRLAPFRVGRKVAARSLERILVPLGTPVWNAFRSLWAMSQPFRSAGPGSHTSVGSGSGAWLDRMSQTDPEAGLRSIASTLFYQAGSLLPLIRIPVLILGGSEDRVVPTRRYAKMGRRIPGSRLVLLKGCSHQAITQAPDKVHTLVEEFLKDQGLLPREDDSE